jgi:predicted metal-binding membrane protein
MTDRRDASFLRLIRRSAALSLRLRDAVLLYAAVGRKAAEGSVSVTSTIWFFAGYIALWIGFSAVATLLQWGLIELALLTPMMATGSALLGGALLVAVAIYQWTPLKDTCLQACQSPLVFLTTHGGFNREPLGAVRLGLAHGDTVSDVVSP